MALPSDIKLPAGARYYQFVEKDLKFNSNYDIVWSFQFRVPGDLGHTGAALPSQDYEYAFGTFLTTLTSDSSLPGQYVGDIDPGVAEARDEILTETDVSILTEEGVVTIIDSSSLSGQLIKVVFDSTGLYGLSGRDGRSGVALKDIKRDSLCIRDYNHDLIYYEYLSTFSPTIPLTSESLNTVRIRYANLGSKISIDREIDSTYQTLTTINVPLKLESYSGLDRVFVGYSFCTPISTEWVQLSVSKLFFKDAHIEGLVSSQVLTETISSAEPNFNPNAAYTTVSNITAVKDECAFNQLWEASQQVAEYREEQGISESVPVELTGEVVSDRDPCRDFVMEISGTRSTRTIVTETVERPVYNGNSRVRISDGTRVSGDVGGGLGLDVAAIATPLCIQSEWNESREATTKKAVIMPAHWVSWSRVVNGGHGVGRDLSAPVGSDAHTGRPQHSDRGLGIEWEFDHWDQFHEEHEAYHDVPQFYDPRTGGYSLGPGFVNITGRGSPSLWLNFLPEEGETHEHYVERTRVSPGRGRKAEWNYGLVIDAKTIEEEVREERIDMQHWHADINTNKGTVRVEQSGVSTPWWRADGIPECDGPDVTSLTETVVVIPGVEIGSIPKERAYDFAVDNNVTIRGHYRNREFLIPSNTLSIFS